MTERGAYWSLICFAMVKNACEGVEDALAATPRPPPTREEGRETDLLDVGRVLRTRLEHADPKLVGELLGDAVLDDLLVREVRLVPDKELVDTLARVAVNLLQPLLDVGERVGVRDIVDNDDAVRAAVVGRGDGAESLLPCGVPL